MTRVLRLKFWLIPVAALVFSVPALAQFEVSPDHFDSNGSSRKKQAAKPASTKHKTQAALANTGPAANPLQATHAVPTTNAAKTPQTAHSARGGQAQVNTTQPAKTASSTKVRQSAYANRPPGVTPPN